MTMPLIVILVFAGVFILYLYNDLVSSRLRIKEAWSQIDVQVKRRADLIPNLVATVKGYAKHEEAVFAQIATARTALLSADKPEVTAQANQALVESVKAVLAVAERYPQLKANEGFLQLQRELSDTEDKIAYARQFYNSAVLDYTRKREMFPSRLVAAQFGFQPEEYFVASEQERQSLVVHFS